MKRFAHLAGFLGLVAAVAAGFLAMTYGATKQKIADQENESKKAALGYIFFDGYARAEEVEPPAGATVNGETPPAYFAVYKNEGDTEPAWYAISGKGFGYNTSVPITLLVGFANPDNKGASPDGTSGYVIVGWKVISSEETPGLGEKAKDEVAPFTWAELATGTAKDAGPDKATTFQKQFRGLTVDELKLKKSGGPIDIITASTYSTRGIIKAMKNALDNLEACLGAKTDT